MEFINKVKENAVVIENATVKELASAINLANIAYHDNDDPILSDDIYDALKEKLEKLKPNHPILQQVGVGTDEENKEIKETDKVKKVNLPYYMPSLDKIKPDGKSIQRWKSKFPGSVVVSSKLDGVSALFSIYYDSKGNKKTYLYSRGGGNRGSDWSHHLANMSVYDVNVTGDKPSPIVVRGELVIPIDVFESKYKDKFYKSARNMVPGLLNAKNPKSEYLKDIQKSFLENQNIEFCWIENKRVLNLNEKILF